MLELHSVLHADSCSEALEQCVNTTDPSSGNWSCKNTCISEDQTSNLQGTWSNTACISIEGTSIVMNATVFGHCSNFYQ